MEKFTQRARRVLSLAHQEAELAHQGLIGTEHLLLGLLEEDGGVAGRVLRELGLETGRVREIIQRVSGEGHYTGGKPDLGPDTQLVLEFALEEARKMGHHYVGTEHLLLGLPRAGGNAAEGAKKAQFCAGCHGPDGNFTHTGSPRLAGQSEADFIKKMQVYRSGQRLYHPLMAVLSSGLKDQDVADLGAFYAAQKVGPGLKPYQPPQ